MPTRCALGLWVYVTTHCAHRFVIRISAPVKKLPSWSRLQILWDGWFGLIDFYPQCLPYFINRFFNKYVKLTDCCSQSVADYNESHPNHLRHRFWPLGLLPQARSRLPIWVWERGFSHHIPPHFSDGLPYFLRVFLPYYSLYLPSFPLVNVATDRCYLLLASPLSWSTVRVT
jgi:hypothetical protein